MVGESSHPGSFPGAEGTQGEGGVPTGGGGMFR